MDNVHEYETDTNTKVLQNINDERIRYQTQYQPALSKQKLLHVLRLHLLILVVFSTPLLLAVTNPHYFNTLTTQSIEALLSYLKQTPLTNILCSPNFSHSQSEDQLCTPDILHVIKEGLSHMYEVLWAEVRIYLWRALRVMRGVQVVMEWRWLVVVDIVPDSQETDYSMIVVKREVTRSILRLGRGLIRRRGAWSIH